jgi:hypothetical protein
VPAPTIVEAQLEPVTPAIAAPAPVPEPPAKPAPQAAKPVPQPKPTPPPPKPTPPPKTAAPTEPLIFSFCEACGHAHAQDGQKACGSH